MEINALKKKKNKLLAIRAGIYSTIFIIILIILIFSYLKKDNIWISSSMTILVLILVMVQMYLNWIFFKKLTSLKNKIWELEEKQDHLGTTFKDYIHNSRFVAIVMFYFVILLPMVIRIIKYF